MTTIATQAAPALNRGMITVSIMLATIMTALDTTIANVALPHMAGSVSASADQITWVLTSYIIATAIMTPMSGWLARRFGAKAVFVVAIIGFTASSALCGAAQSLGQIVAFRVLQGVFSAPMAPLSQAVMVDIYAPKERGPALAVWSMGVMVAPIVGPVLGGWLTDDFSWRWVFYINLPFGVVALLGMLAFLPSDRHDAPRRFDLTGFAFLSVMLASTQLFLDRGAGNDWFNSTETTIEAWVAVVALALFVIHSLLAEQPFLPLELARDRNYVATVLVSLMVTMLVFSVLALLPPMMETLLGYPVITTGLVTASRGVGSLISMYAVGQMIGRVDTRLLVALGIVMFAVSFQLMSQFSLGMNSDLIEISGFIQGMGVGFAFMPMTTLGYATMRPSLRGDAAGVNMLARNLGNSAGISIIEAIFTSKAQIAHARLVERLTPDNPLARPPYLPAPFSLTSPAGLAALNGMVDRQASMVAYVGVFQLMFLATLAVLPVLLLVKPTPAAPVEEFLIEH
jgi:DHA2 family multidrug resistance protein